MGSRGQSRKRQLAQLDRASDKYNGLQERADSISNIGGRFYDNRTGQEVPREDVEKLDRDLTASRERFEDLRDRMIEREERRNAGRQEQAEAVDNDDVLFSNFAEQSNAQTSAERARERAAKRQATREKQTKNARMTAGDWIKNQVNVDIEKYRDSATKQFDKRGYITVDWKSMPRTERAYIEQLAQKYPNRIQLFDAGAWAKQIRFKR